MVTAFSVPAKGKQEAEKAEGKTEQASGATEGKSTASSPEIDREKQAAIVNGEGISLIALDEEVSMVSNQMASSGQPVPAEREEEFRMQVLDSMISRQLLLAEAGKLGIELSEEDIDARIEEIKAQFPSEEEFTAALEGQGLTLKRLRADLKDNLVIQELLKQEVEDKIEVSDEDARSFYDDNPEQFQQPAQIKASHIILTLEEGAGEEQKAEARNQLQEIKAEIEGGADFAAMAKENSQGPSASRGGDLGFFSRGQMVKAFEDAAFELEVGELSDIVETQFGFHLITVTDKKDASTVAYETVIPQIKEYLQQQKTSGEFDRYLQKLRDDADIEILIEGEAS